MKINYKILRNILYVLGLILFIYFIYLLYGTCTYLAGLIKVEEIKLLRDFGKVIEFIMTKSFSYLFYSISFLTLGALVSICDKGNQIDTLSSEEK